MNRPRTRKKLTIKNTLAAAAACLFLLACLAAILWYFWHPSTANARVLRYVSTIAGTENEFGEPFGIAVLGAAIFVSDGQNGKIWRISGGVTTAFAEGLDTPSGIAFDKNGNLIVADSGSNSIKSIDSAGKVTTIAGVDGRSGFADGGAGSALFNGPVGVTASPDGRIFVADTYNDRIRVIENGRVTTLAGGKTGFADGTGADSRFHTPCGIALSQDRLIVADTGNARVRVVRFDGTVSTLAGTGEVGFHDGLLASALLVEPTGVAVDAGGTIFITDGNSVRMIGGRSLPFVTTIAGDERGLRDGPVAHVRFNRPSGIAFDQSGDLLVADSDSRVVRSLSVGPGHEITAAEVDGLRDKPETFRTLQNARWPYDPPTARREIAGTMGEIRGEIPEQTGTARFHNGLDIAGAYGETARFVRNEKVLDTIATANFGTLRESLRMPSLGYIHIRLGRDQASKPFADDRFQFIRDQAGKMVDVRVARGVRFTAGEAIGTLNPMNHVHLIAGHSGCEMNALDALIFPNLTDSRAPVIEKVTLFDDNWHEIETGAKETRITLTGKTHVVVRAYDQADGNAERRRLGVYRVGYVIFSGDAPAAYQPKNGISFARMPTAGAVKLAYGEGSRSGATGETVFNYIATNFVDGDIHEEGFLDAAELGAGVYNLQVRAADYFGNQTVRNIPFEVRK